MCGRPYLDTMHADHANLIMWYLSIRWSNVETEHTIVTVRISRSFLWYAMNELIHVMQRQIDACNAIMIFGVHGWSFQSSALIKSWMQNQVSTIVIIQGCKAAPSQCGIISAWILHQKLSLQVFWNPTCTRILRVLVGFSFTKTSFKLKTYKIGP